MRHLRSLWAAVATVVLVAAPARAQVPVAALPAAIPAAEMDAIEAATERYRDIEVALADGYVLPMDMCVDAPFEGLPRQLGAMGLHYVRPDLLGITGDAPRVNGVGTHTDFHQPSILVYEPQADGSQRLVAIENLVWAAAWHEAGNTAAPSFKGFEYHYMHDNPETEVDEAHGFEPHYELHMWLYKENPSGMFQPFNPDVSCENYTSSEAHAAH